MRRWCGICAWVVDMPSSSCLRSWSALTSIGLLQPQKPAPILRVSCLATRAPHANPQKSSVPRLTEPKPRPKLTDDERIAIMTEVLGAMAMASAAEAKGSELTGEVLRARWIGWIGG